MTWKFCVTQYKIVSLFSFGALLSVLLDHVQNVTSVLKPVAADDGKVKNLESRSKVWCGAARLRSGKVVYVVAWEISGAL